MAIFQGMPYACMFKLLFQPALYIRALKSALNKDGAGTRFRTSWTYRYHRSPRHLAVLTAQNSRKYSQSA